MPAEARLDLAVWRNDDLCEIPIRVRGRDLTGDDLLMEVRLVEDTPGVPLISLAKVDNGNAEGLRVAGVTVENGVPVTDLRLRFNKSTRQALPYAGELGQSASFRYALSIAKKTRLVGAFTVLAHAIGSNNAPMDRPAGYGLTAAGAGASSGATLTIVDNEVTELVLDGADLIGAEVDRAAAASLSAGTAATRAEQGAAAVLARLDESKQILPQTGGAGVGIDFTDANGRTWLGADQDEIYHPKIDELARGTPAAQPGGDEFGIAAPDGTMKWSIGDERIRHSEIREIRSAAGINGWEEVRVTGEIVGVPISGASHSRGFLANPAISTAASPYAVTFAGGVRPDDGPDPFGALKALVEQTKGDLGETIASGMAEMIAQLLAGEGINAAAANQRLLFSTSGEPGTPIATLADEASSLAVRFKAAIANGQARAADLGRTYAPLCIPFPAGSTDIGNDVTGAAWKASARKLRRWAQAHANAVCGTVSRPLPMLIAQQTTHRWYGRSPAIALAQVELAREDAFIGLVCAGGILPTVNDNLHFTATGSKWLGAMMGFIAYWWFWRGVKIAPLVPTARVQGSRVILRFPVRPGRKLALDVATVPLQHGWGITAVGANGADVGVSNPRLSGSDTIIVDTAAPLAPGSKVRLGWTGSAYNGLTNIRDDDPTIFDPNGLKLPIWQWAPICEVSL